MRNSPFWWGFVLFMLSLDFYFFQALKVVASSAAPRTKLIIYTTYWILSGAAIILFILLPYINFDKQGKMAYSTVYAIIAGLFFAKLVASLFFLIDDIIRLIRWIIAKFSAPAHTDAPADESDSIPRSVFLSWAGMAVGGGLFGTLIYGFRNKYRYEVRRNTIRFSNLPPAFKGLKAVHISDIHSGSFADKQAVMRGVEKIMAEKPDIIFFTGDLVNNVATEMDDYLDVFDKLKAPYGVYSTLGNHDYGDYVSWESIQHKMENLDQLKNVHKQLGWRLLMNEHVVLEKDGQQIAVLGIENWSVKARFPKYGSMKQAYEGAENYPFKILLSHDPSHWKAEVCKRYQDIDLMLSGHTHGMQFGIEIPGFKWSPVKYLYKEWAGLYENGKQRLYVNRGFGFLGYPGRVGILPEITVLEFV